MWLKSKNKSSLLIFVLLFSLLAPQKIFPFEKKNAEDTYTRLIQIYEEWSKLEDETFEMLSFKLSPIQISLQGYNPKLILEDNLGRKWIFKPKHRKTEESGYWRNYTQAQIAVVVYKVYKIFGLQTPRIHFTTLNINGKQISGTIQRFIPNIGTLSKRPPHKLSPKALNYILKSHTIDWLLANYDSSPQNFLVLSLNKTNKPNKIMRIDNENALNMSNTDELRYDWVYSKHAKPFTKYYYRLWKDYILKNINLDTGKNFAFIKLVSELPNDFFVKVITPAKTHNFELFSHSTLERIKKNYENSLELMILRKARLIQNFEVFYKDVVKKRGESLNFHKNRDYRKIIHSNSKNLSEEIKELKKEKTELQESPSFSSGIDIIFSFEGFLILKRIYNSYWIEEERDLIPLCDNALKRFSVFLASAKNGYEKEALGIYTKEVEKIRAGASPTFHLREISKIIKFVVPKN